MTHKTTMPEPVGKSMYLLDEVGNLVPTGYTPDQMEAYAEARVRAALEEAANMCDDVFAFSVGDSIRALIPKEPPCET